MHEQAPCDGAATAARLAFGAACQALDSTHKLTRDYRPHTNGKADLCWAQVFAGAVALLVEAP